MRRFWQHSDIRFKGCGYFVVVFFNISSNLSYFQTDRYKLTPHLNLSLNWLTRKSNYLARSWTQPSSAAKDWQQVNIWYNFIVSMYTLRGGVEHMTYEVQNLFSPFPPVCSWCVAPSPCSFLVLSFLLRSFIQYVHDASPRRLVPSSSSPSSTERDKSCWMILCDFPPFFPLFLSLTKNREAKVCTLVCWNGSYTNCIVDSKNWQYSID